MEHTDSFDIRKSILAVLRRKRLVIILALFGLVIGAAFKGTQAYGKYRAHQNNSSVQVEALIQQKKALETNVNYLNAYARDSILMNLNPLSAPSSHLKIYVSNDYQLDRTSTLQDRNPLGDILGAYVAKPITAEMVRNINEELHTNYTLPLISELIFIKIEPNSAVLEIMAFGKDAKESQVILQTFVQGAYIIVNESVSPHEISIFGEQTSISHNDNLDELQKEYLESIDIQKSNLTKLQTSIDEALEFSNFSDIIKSSLKFTLLSIIAFTGLAILLCLILDTMDNRLYSPKDFSPFKPPVLGVVTSGKRNGYTRLIHTLEETPETRPDHQWDVIAQTLLTKHSGSQQNLVLVTGSPSEAVLHEKAVLLCSHIRSQGGSAILYDEKYIPAKHSEPGQFLVRVSSNITDNGETIPIAKKASAILLVEKLGESRKYTVRNQLERYQELEQPVEGFVLI